MTINIKNLENSSTPVSPILADNCQTPLKVSERQKLVLEIQNHKFTDRGNKHKFPYPTAQQQDPNIGHSAWKSEN